MSILRRAGEATGGCTLRTCEVKHSLYSYQPSLAANVSFLVLFSISLFCYLTQAFLSRRFVGFTIAMVCGCSIEVLGYIGRVISWHNPFLFVEILAPLFQNGVGTTRGSLHTFDRQPGFLMQICCLTIAPAFLAAGIYLTISRIVTVFGPHNSGIAPRLYPLIFIPCDIFSLLLQAAGGGIASSASQKKDGNPRIGSHIMVAGLALQSVTLLFFMVLCVDFALRTRNRMRTIGPTALDPTHAKLRASRTFQGFLWALALATICIFIRSVYRVAELSEGWDGYLIKSQGMFVGFEGALVITAVFALNVFHPGYCFKEGYEGVVARRSSTMRMHKHTEKGDDLASNGI